MFTVYCILNLLFENSLMLVYFLNLFYVVINASNMAYDINLELKVNSLIIEKYPHYHQRENNTQILSSSRRFNYEIKLI